MKIQRPELKVYGNIQSLTKAVAKTTKNADGGVGLIGKTN